MLLKYIENYRWLKEMIEVMFLSIIVQAPAEENFDQIVAMLKDTTASCPVIFNCQVKIKKRNFFKSEFGKDFWYQSFVSRG